MAGKRGLFFKDGGKTGVVFLKMACERGLLFKDDGKTRAVF
jgi:hypothetical protein